MVFGDPNYKEITMDDSNFGIDNKIYRIQQQNLKTIQRLK